MGPPLFAPRFSRTSEVVLLSVEVNLLVGIVYLPSRDPPPSPAREPGDCRDSGPEALAVGPEEPNPAWNQNLLVRTESHLFLAFPPLRRKEPVDFPESEEEDLCLSEWAGCLF